MGTKLRALYQRRKGRDLFDLWVVLKNNLIDPQEVIKIYLSHCEKEKLIVTRALFEKSMAEKIRNKDFKADISNLLAADQEWSFDEAHEMVQEKIICLLPGDAWKTKKR
jgi:predicted nucleotidyltransferase component of viral defense system